MTRTPRLAALTALTALAALVELVAAPGARAAAPEPVRVPLQPDAAGRPFPHFWESMFGSGRAVLALRESYRDDLRLMKQAADFQYVRFHAIFHDEVGLYNEGGNRALFYNQGRHDEPFYNFSYVDQIYDGLLANGVRPFVELSFMPRKLSMAPKVDFDFWYKPNHMPPKDYAKWDAMIGAFVRHLVERYGIDEVAQWYFEVWNEPNIGFWGGKPRQKTYFELYDHTARAIKAVDPRLRIGGPSTAQAAWAEDFVAHVVRDGIPADFVSSHVYANDTVENVFGAKGLAPVARDRMVCTAVKKVRDEVSRSARPELPVIFSEYNASYANEPNVTDDVYMGPWLASTVRQCDGLTAGMSFWSFSDVFEEGGVVRTPFYGGFGAIAAGGIPKPVYNAFALLHRLGELRLPSASEDTLVTRRADGTLAIALWNYAPPDATGARYEPPRTAGPARRFILELPAGYDGAPARLSRVDREHGNVVSAFDAMGRPSFPSREQARQLRDAARLPAPQVLVVRGATLEVDVPTHGLALVELAPVPRP
jgi:xylan 1,4-beta-xylosidase